MAAPLHDGPVPGSLPVQGSTPAAGPTQPPPSPRIEGKITPSLNRLSTHQNTVPVSKDARLGITLLANRSFTQIPPLPPTPPNIPLPKPPTAAAPQLATLPTATQSSKSLQKGNASKDSTRSETTVLGSRILMGKKGQEEDVFGEDKPPSDEQAHQNNNITPDNSEKPSALKKAEQNLKKELEYRNSAEEKRKVMADELNAIPSHLKTEQQQHQYNKQEGVVYAARLNVIQAGIEVLKATPKTAQNEAFLTDSMTKLEAEAKGLRLLCLQTGKKVAGEEIKMLKETLKSLNDENAIKDTNQALQKIQDLHQTLSIHLYVHQSFLRVDRINRRENANRPISAQEITASLAKASESTPNTTAKTQETSLDILSTSEIPATETTKPVDTSAKIEKSKTQLYYQTKEVVTTEKTFTSQLGIMLGLKEMILNPNSPDAIKAKQQIDAFYQKMTPAQKEEFKNLFNKIDTSNIEAIKKFSEEINQKFEQPYSELTSVEAKLKANTEELKKPDLSEERKDELTQETHRMIQERDKIALQLSDIFSSIKIPDHIFTAVTDHFQAVEKFGQFIANNQLKAEWLDVLEGYKNARVGVDHSKHPEGQLYSSFTTAETSIFAPVFQRYCKYVLLAREPSATLNKAELKSLPEYANAATNASKGFEYFSQKTAELNTLQRHLEDTKNALTMATTVNTNPDKSGRLVGEGKIPAQRQRLRTNIRGLAPGHRAQRATVNYQKPAPTKQKPLEEHETLKNVRDTLQAGLNAQNALIEKKNETLQQAKTVAERNKLSEEIQVHRVIAADLTKSMSKINNSAWATAVDAQGKTRNSMNLEAINKTSVELAQTLNIHTPSVTIAVNTPRTPLTEFNATNDRAKNIMLGAAYTTKQKDLQTLQAQGKKQIDGFINDIAIPKSYEQASTVETSTSNNATEARIVRTEDKITQELFHLEVFVRDHPEFEAAFFKLSGALLEKANRPPLSEKGYAELENDLKQISEGVQMIEAAIVHKQEMEVLGQPERVASREAVHETTRIAKKSSELVQLKETLKTAIAEDIKLTMDTQGLHTTKRTSNFLNIDTKRFQGSSSEAAATVHMMLKTLDDTNDAGLRSQVNEILTLMKSEGSWVNAVIKEHASVADALTKLEDKLTKLPPKAELGAAFVAATPINIAKELFTPPGNPQLEKAFLNSSHIFLSKLTQAEGTPDVKFFAFLKENLENATTLYQQQKILDLAQKWVEDPFINGGKVKNREAEIRELATRASGSATMNVKAAKLLETLDTVIATPAQPPSTGTKSVLHTIENIANGSPKPGSPEYQQAVRDLADSITAQSAASFKAISSTEFETKEPTPNRDRAAAEFNHLSQFVQLSILEPTTAHSKLDLAQQQQQSARVIEFFVNVQAELISSNSPLVNFNGFMAINSALESSGIKRLSAVQNLLPKEIEQKQVDHNALAEPSHNSQAMNNEMKKLSNNQQPFIPYVGLIASQILFANEANKNFNSNKVALVGNIIASLGEMNRNVTTPAQPAYNLGEITTVGSSYNESTAYARSLALNPRPQRPSTALPE